MEIPDRKICFFPPLRYTDVSRKKGKEKKENERKKINSIDEYVDTIITWYKKNIAGDISVYEVCIAFNKGWNPGYSPKYLAKEIEEMLEEERNGEKLTSFTEHRARKKELHFDQNKNINCL